MLFPAPVNIAPLNSSARPTWIWRLSVSTQWT